MIGLVNVALFFQKRLFRGEVSSVPAMEAAAQDRAFAKPRSDS